jgi:Coenzyme PQQ synthesis protein D (PqqD)
VNRKKKRKSSPEKDEDWNEWRRKTMKKITNFDSSPRRKEQIIVQKGSSDLLLFNMDNGSYYALNEVGSRTWELCDGTHSVAQLVCILAKEYDASVEILETDILELLEDLQSKNLIVECSGNFTGCDASAGRQASQ